MKLLAYMLLSLIVIALSACVSEEGAQKHAQKGSEMTAKAGVVPGMMWEAAVHKTGTAKSMELGHFASREECHEAISVHASEQKKAKKGFSASTCSIVASDR